MTRLGKTQLALLRALAEHGSWRRGAGWVWDTRGATERLLDRLAERGMVEKMSTMARSPGMGGQVHYWSETTYRISAAGKEAISR